MESRYPKAMRADHRKPVPDDDEWDTKHAWMKHVVDSVNRLCSEDTRVLCADVLMLYMRCKVHIPCIN